DNGDDGEEGDGDDDDDDEDDDGEKGDDDDDDQEVEKDDEKDDEEEGNGEEDLGLNVGRKEGHNEEEEEDELYRDVNINQGRGIQANLDVKDSHVTLTPVNPVGQQQSSSVSSQFVISMLNPTLDVDTIIDQQVAMDEALVPHAQRLRIGKSNFRLLSDIKYKESTLQLVYDVLRLCLFFKAFLVTADVPKIYMQEF
nr:hypothetical protein [Tanacetum cinerariifolium]